MFKSAEEPTEDTSSTASHDGHMIEEDDSGDEIMFREEERSFTSSLHKSRIPVPVSGLFGHHVVSLSVINLCGFR